jgi:DNA repair exonuclease SbcCD ATPase subunit
MKRPSWPTIILGFLNIIAAGFLMSLAVKDFYARIGWSRHIEDGIRARDGLVRYGLLDDDETRKLIDGDPALGLEPLSEEGKKKLEEMKGSSLFVQRRTAADLRLDPIRDKGSELISAREGNPEKQIDKLRKALGAKDTEKLLQNHYMLRHPQLRAEEQQVAELKATQLALRETYQKQIAQLEIEIARLDERLKAEKATTAQQEQENDERRKELQNLYAELEEALAARGLAEGRLKDLQDHLALTKRRFAELSKQTDQLEEQIRKTEGVGDK